MRLPPPLVPALLAATLLLGVVGQFVPVAHFEEDEVPGLPPGSVYAEADGYVWRTTLFASVSISGNEDERHDSKSWYDGDFDEEKGIGNVRVAGPLLAAACALVLVAIVVVLRSPLVGAILAAAGLLLLGLGTGLLYSGLQGIFDDQQSWTWGFWLLLGAAVVGLAATVLAFLGRQPAEPAPATFPGQQL